MNTSTFFGRLNSKIILKEKFLAEKPFHENDISRFCTKPYGGIYTKCSLIGIVHFFFCFAQKQKGDVVSYNHITTWI